MKLKLEGVELEKDLKKAEADIANLCSKYFDRRRDYVLKKERIINLSKKGLEDLKINFVQKISPVVEGYDISLYGKKISAEELFEVIAEKSHMEMEAKLVPKAPKFIFRKSANQEAKEVVLRYLIQEVIAGVVSAREDEARALAALDSEFFDLKELEEACREAEKRRAQILKEKDKKKEKLKELYKKIKELESLVEAMLAEEA